MTLGNKIVGNILGGNPNYKLDKWSKNRVILPNVKQTIDTVKGKAKYIGTEVEDVRGNWNDRYAIRDGYWVIHEGKKHHVYEE